MLQKHKNEASHHVNFFSKMLFGEVSDYRSIPFANYRFEGNDIIVKEYTGDEKRVGTDIKINLADVVYALNYNTPIVNNVEQGFF